LQSLDKYNLYYVNQTLFRFSKIFFQINRPHNAYEFEDFTVQSNHITQLSTKSCKLYNDCILVLSEEAAGDLSEVSRAECIFFDSKFNPT